MHIGFITIDRDILLGNLPHQDRKIFEVMSDGNTQKEAAEELGVTQGYISSALKKADRSVDDYIFKTGTRAEIVWHCWNRFMKHWEMPYFLDVELEFVLRKLLCDLMPFTHWFYSFGELCRYKYLEDKGLDWTIENLPEHLHGVDKQAEDMYNVLYAKLSHSPLYKRTGEFMEDYLARN